MEPQFSGFKGRVGWGTFSAPRELVSALPAIELTRRPSRPPDYVSENLALVALARTMAANPDGILQELAETALKLCRAHSAGISLLTADRTRFYWAATAGEWASHRGGGTPREFGPCVTVLDRNIPMIFSRPERDFPYLGEVTPLLEDSLLIPFYINGEAVGTIWIISHDENHRFDSEDLRVMNNLGIFAAAAYQNLLSLKAAQRNTFIIESSDDAIVSKNLDGVITGWNNAAARLFGYTAGEMIGQSIMTLIPPHLHGEERTIIERIARGERIDHYETVRRRKDGSLIPVSLTISPIKNADGEIIGASKIPRDISRQKREEEHVALLTGELDHRSRNLLALAQGIIRLTQGDTIASVKTAIEGRLQALAKVHDLMAQSCWTGADIRILIAEELSPYCRGGESRAEIVGPHLLLKPQSAQAIAVVVHELTTNAVKYGALSVREGRVRVEWSRTTDGRVLIVWAESNGPPAKPPSRRGFGTAIVDRIIRAEPGGYMHYDWRAEGLTARIGLSVTE